MNDSRRLQTLISQNNNNFALQYICPWLCPQNIHVFNVTLCWARRKHWAAARAQVASTWCAHMWNAGVRQREESNKDTSRIALGLLASNIAKLRSKNIVSSQPTFHSGTTLSKRGLDPYFPRGRCGLVLHTHHWITLRAGRFPNAVFLHRREVEVNFKCK